MCTTRAQCLDTNLNIIPLPPPPLPHAPSLPRGLLLKALIEPFMPIVHHLLGVVLGYELHVFGDIVHVGFLLFVRHLLSALEILYPLHLRPIPVVDWGNTQRPRFQRMRDFWFLGRVRMGVGWEGLTL